MKWLPLISALICPLSAQAAALTLYTTSWSIYGKNPYEYDGAYKNGQPYGSLTYVQNPDMVAQFNQADVVAWSFLQVWNTKDQYQSKYKIPENWSGLMHFNDLWSELPFEASWVSPLPPETQDFLNFCKANKGSCSAIQFNEETKNKKLSNYTARKGIGQLNTFGAFINSNKYTAKRIISIGGANSIENHAVSTASFEAIFANRDKFLTQFKAWMDHFKNLKGLDYDFEPPINLHTGAQLKPGEKTLSDYKNLYELVKASREKLGPDAYISVTITADKYYLEKINESIEGGWFRQIAPYVNALNLMTYDNHGAWYKSTDPYTAVHSYVKQPNTEHKDEFALNYGADATTEQVLSYGLPREKLQLGIAAYGRGYSGVEVGSNSELPGFEQAWKGLCFFKNSYTNEKGLLPYNSVPKVMENLGYKSYNLREIDENGNSFITASYLYSPETKQFVGYQSPESVKALCELVKKNQLQGSIMWSADSDLPVWDSRSLLGSYRALCN